MGECVWCIYIPTGLHLLGLDKESIWPIHTTSCPGHKQCEMAEQWLTCSRESTFVRAHCASKDRHPMNCERTLNYTYDESVVTSKPFTLMW